ncbi:MAG: hypothetical protein ACRDKE_04075 [Solirubrobacterales bacterium]
MTRKIVKTLVAAFVAGALLTGCGSSGEQSFTTPTYPFSFDYPEGWTLSRGANFTYGSGDTAVRSVSAALKEPYDQVTITQYKLKKTLPAGVNGYQPEVDRIVARLTKQANGTASDAKVVKYGGQPGYQYIVEYPGGEKIILQNKLTFLFKGQYEFQINCQSSEKNREALNEGCDQILDSLKFE